MPSPSQAKKTPCASAHSTGLEYYHQEQHMSYERTEASLLALYEVEISQGGIDQIMQRSEQQGTRAAAEIQRTVQQSAVVNSDETGARVDG